MTPSSVPRRVFVIWLGGPMPPVRGASLAAIRQHVGVETVLITEDTLDRWVPPDAPLHPAFGRLSAVHQADYLRCYFMHHHGGGYLDLKPLAADWRPAFDQLDATPEAFAIGYREPGPQGVASLGFELLPQPRFLHAAWWRRRWLQLHYRQLIGTCAFVFRPRSIFTTQWITGVTRRLDHFAVQLEAHPSQHPRDHAGFPVDGRPSGYPVPYMALLADVFHPLARTHRHRLLKTLPPPSFEGYR